MLRQVVTAGEFLAALMAFEWFVLSVEGSVVSLEVFLTSEAAVAELTDEGLGGVLGQRLLATSAVDSWLLRSSTCIRAGTHHVGIGLGRA